MLQSTQEPHQSRPILGPEQLLAVRTSQGPVPPEHSVTTICKARDNPNLPPFCRLCLLPPNSRTTPHFSKTGLALQLSQARLRVKICRRASTAINLKIPAGKQILSPKSHSSKNRLFRPHLPVKEAYSVPKAIFRQLRVYLSKSLSKGSRPPRRSFQTQSAIDPGRGSPCLRSLRALVNRWSRSKDTEPLKGAVMGESQLPATNY